ncbi:maleylpyruvate isomerase family mycothiol-dependent enzyme [Streptomyces sp. NBC_01267]|uniref:maleylpyruvate isomerase family mycothiol-dependent enzyme n=1 Tax=unclassified Streptomyces TaxID=2593676 RepID=UPI002E32E42B|nr:maleylpyruvate isomerase family mycothiol-dependent enzyme [Streptomyces sp. NBC_01267]WSV52381.1 maleylpyruvate isomerase family mycothiol-dependent enzyme [Streptomyces sp. NBC_01014]
MTSPSYERHCAEITVQSDLLRACIEGADLTVPVPSCPGWHLGRLVRHLGEAHRWVEEIVRTRAQQPLPDTALREEPAGPGDEQPADLGAWLVEGAKRLVETLREAGPDAQLWTPVSGSGGSSAFFARRMAHETLIHRADAALAVGAEFTVEADVAVDALDEWMELGSLPQLFEIHPEQRELLGPGRTLHFHATDTAPELKAEWVVDLTGDTVTWRRAHERAAVAVRGPLTDLLLTVYRRRPARGGSVDVLGDGHLLDFWLERVSFG